MKSTSMPSEPRLVLVMWDDAWGDQDNFASSHGIAMSHRPMAVQTLGWLIHDDETGISVVNERSMAEGSEVYRGRTFIPRAMVTDCIEFKLAPPKRKRSTFKLSDLAAEKPSLPESPAAQKAPATPTP